MKLKNLTNLRFGRLLVLYRTKESKQTRWMCKCDCGNIKSIRSTHLISGKIVSCGCYKKERQILGVTKHGLSKSRIYRIYRNMINRCYWEKQKEFKYWGGKGIIVYDKWKNDFMNFYNWSMNNGYEENLTIDRIDNNKNYEPSNCRWVTAKKQAENLPTVKLYEYNGEINNLFYFAHKYNCEEKLIRGRVSRGWNIKKALETPRQNPLKNLKYNKIVKDNINR